MRTQLVTKPARNHRGIGNCGGYTHEKIWEYIYICIHIYIIYIYIYNIYNIYNIIYIYIIYNIYNIYIYIIYMGNIH